MKKIVVLLGVVLVIAVALTGCFKSDKLEENKITAPVPNNLEVYGTWKIEAEYTIGDNNTYKKVENIKKPIITISDKSAIVGDMEIDNPTFKFKRVVKNNYLPDAFDSLVNDIPLDKGYMNIITVSDNTNLYLDFIMKNNNEGYIYAVGDLIKVKRIESNVDETNNSAAINSKEKQNSGILLGIKSPVIGSNGKATGDMTYKTYWISMVDDKLQDTIIMNGLVLPRVNGTFSYIDAKNSIQDGKPVQTLEVINHNKNGKAVTQENVMPESSDREITFVGKDYIGTEFKNIKNNQEAYKLLTVDNINGTKGLDMTGIFGQNGERDYLNSREQFINSKPSFVLDKYNLGNYSTSDITMFRKNARWVVQGNIDSDVVGVNDLVFDINVSPVGTLVNYDALPVSWNKIKDIDSKAIDAFSSPSGNFIVVLNDKSINIYMIKNGDIESKPARVIPISSGDTAIMGEWATGDFVSLWNKAVEEKIKK